MEAAFSQLNNWIQITVPTSKFCNINFIFTCPLWSAPSEIKGFWDTLFYLIEKGNESTSAPTLSQQSVHFEANLPDILTFCTLVHRAEGTDFWMKRKPWSALQDFHVTPLLLKAVRPQDQAKFSLKQNFTEPKQASMAQTAGPQQQLFGFTDPFLLGNITYSCTDITRAC